MTLKTKKCTKCKKIKDINRFYKGQRNKDGYSYICKNCDREKNKNNYLENKDKILERGRIYRLNNLEKCRNRVRIANKKSRKNNPEKHRECFRKWYILNGKERMRRWRAENRIKSQAINKRYENKRKLSKRFSTLIYQSLKQNKNSEHWENLVGFTLRDLKEHLQKLFKPGMSWSNYGKWHIDHIIPISFFKFDSYDNWEFKYCFNLANLQPLWAYENLSKGAKI